MLRAAAVDAAGNVDPTPAERTVRADGEINTLTGVNVVADITTPPGVDPAVSGEVTFAVVSRPGATWIEPLAAPPAEVPAGAYQAGARYYDIGTTATFQAPVTVCVEFDPAQVAEPNRMRLLHYENGAWADVTGPPSELANGILCGRVTSLSPFAIAVSTAPVADQAPDTTITRGPGASTVNAVAVFEFRGSDDLTDVLELEFACALDGGPFEACDSPHETAALPAGPHRMEIRAVDLAGNVDPTPAVRTWTVVDLTPLDTAIESGPDSPTTATSATFTFVAEPEVPGDEVGATFRCAVNEGDFAPCTSPHTVTGLTTPGAQVFLVTAVDAAGNADPTPDLYEWVVEGPADTTTPPETTILGGPPATVASETPTLLTFTADQAGVEFECRQNGGAWEPCESPVEYQGLPEGAYTVDVRALRTVELATGDVTLVDATPATYGWAVTRAPETVIDAPPASPVPGSTATFAFSADQPGSTFACAVDGGELQPCTSPFTVQNLVEGPHTIAVQATNPLRAVDPTPATYSWTQGLPPETVITATEQVVDPTEPDVVTLQVRFTGSDDQTPALDLEFECRLDDGPWNGCELQQDIAYSDLPPGEHVFQVRARDLGQSLDPTPAEHRFTIAETPDTGILADAPGTPAPQTESTTATFNFSSGQDGVTFECSLDRSPEPVFAPCTSPATFADLPPGEHEFVVRARGATGVVDPEPAVFTWVIGDLTPPTLTLVSGPPAQTGDTTATVTFTADDPGLTFTCSLDGAQPGQFCTSPHTLENLSAAAHVLEITASKPHLLVEPEPLVVSWTVTDAAPPDTVILAAPTAPVADNGTATVTFAGTDNGTPAEQLTFECALDGAAFAGCSSPQELSGLPVGEHSLAVRAVDLAGLTDPSPVTATWTVADTTAPETTIVTGPAQTTQETTARFEFSSTEPGTFTCAVDATPIEPCTSPLEITDLGVGVHRFSVAARDAGGNADTSAAVHEWTVEAPPDVTPPDVVLTTAPATTGSSATTALFAFTASEPGVTFTCTLDAGGAQPCTSPVQVTGLAPGAHQMRIEGVDAAGNPDPTPVMHSWTVAAPPPAGPACSAPGETLTANGDTWVLQSSPGQTAGQDSTLKITSKSGNGNARALVTFALPAIPPGCVVADAQLRMFLASPVSGRTLQAYRADSAWTEGGATWNNARNHTGPAAETASGSTAGWRQWSVLSQVQANYTGPNRGFLLRDRTENAGAGPEQGFHSREAQNRPQLVLTFGQPPDTVAPNTVIDAAPPAETVGTEATVAFSATEPGSTFACAVDGAAFTPCSSPITVTGLAPGPHTVAVRATDPAGNVDGSPATVSWTVVGGAAPLAAPPPPPPTTTAAPPTTTPTTTTPAPPGCTQGSVTLAADADTWIAENDPGKNNGSDSVLKVTSKPGENARALVRFALPQVPAGCQIVGAELRLHDGSPKPGHTLQAWTVSGAWSENGVTWADQPGTTGTPATAATPSSAATMVWAVTDQVRAMAVGPNHGFLIRAAGENGNGDEQAINSREKAPDDPPQLVVVFG